MLRRIFSAAAQRTLQSGNGRALTHHAGSQLRLAYLGPLATNTSAVHIGIPINHNGASPIRFMHGTQPLYGWKGATKKEEKPTYMHSQDTIVLLIDGVHGQGKMGNLTLSEAQEFIEGKGGNTLLQCVNDKGKVPVYKTISPETIKKQEQEKEKQRQASLQILKDKKRADKARAATTKEVKFSAGAGDHDVDVKLKQVKRFLNKGLFVDIKIRGNRGRSDNDGTTQGARLDAFIADVEEEYDNLVVKGYAINFTEKYGRKFAMASCTLKLEESN